MNTKYTLQLRHSEVYSTREDAINEIDVDLRRKHTSILPYEPILFYYGEDDNINTILLVGLPEGVTKNGKSYFIIDTAELQEEIDAAESESAAISERLENEIEERKAAIEAEAKTREEADAAEAKTREEADAAEAKAREAKDVELETSIATEKSERIESDKALDESIKFNVDDLKSIVKACGLIYNEKLSTDRVSYVPDLHDEIIRDAKTVSEAVTSISAFVGKISKSLQVAVEDTDTVKLYKADNEKDGGSVISAEVNIAGTDGLSRKNYDNNIIGKTSDGLYASASIEPSASNPNVLIFKTSGYIDGQFKVDAYETEVPLSVYKGDEGKKTGVEITVDDTKNIISAQLNLASDKTNLLRLEDGEYMVEGMAKNIKYKDTTVAQALNAQTNRLDEIEDSIEFVKSIDVKGGKTETTSVSVEKSSKGDFTVTSDVKLGSDNSIIVSNGGLTANVSASFKKGTSTLVIEVGKNSYSIDLSDLAVSVLKSASYDSTTEEIVLTFLVGDSERTVRVPVGTLIHDIEVDDTDTIDLTLRSVSGGPNHISAELKVDKSHSDNILTVTSSGAYVSKSYITEAVKEETNARKESDEELKKMVEKVSDLAAKNKEDIAEEAKTARAAEKENATTIAQEIKDARAAEKANADAIATNAALIKTNETAISEETARAQKSEKANADAITAEATRAAAAETKNANAIASEVDRATEKEQDLLDKIGNNTTKIGENKTAIAQEIKDARAAEKANADAIAAEVKRASAAEASNATAISKEELRAIAAEEKNAASISEEVKRATKAEEVLTVDVAANSENIANVTSVANTTKADLANEITRAKASEKANADAVAANTAAITTSATKVAELDKVVVEEVTRAKKAEEANATAISTERDRAMVAEQANAASIADEIVRAKKAEETNAASVTENKAAISALDKTLQNEVTRATDAEAANAKAINTETKRATEVEVAMNEKIAKNASDIATISTSVGNIELKKEGDLAYALYVNGTKHGEFTIPQDQFLKSVNYDANKKAIVFVFNTTSGEQTQEVSVADLVDTYTNGEGVLLNGNAFSVDFTKVASVDLVNVEVSRAKTKETELSTAIDSVNTNVDDATKRIAANETNITSLTEKLTAETNRAIEAEKKNAENVDAEAKRAKEAEVNLQTSVNANSDAIVANSAAILSETTRAKEVEEQIKKLNSETSGKIDTAIIEVKGLLTNEVTRSTEKDDTLQKAIDGEITRAKKAEDEIKSSVSENKASLVEIDKTLKNEITRAEAAETANATAVSTETKRATEVEAAINDKVAKNASDIAAISTSVGNIELKKEGDLAYALYVNGTKHGELTIPQDQFLKSVTYDSTDKSIVLVFNTASGEQTQKVSVADLVDTYTNGEGVLLNGNAFSVDFTKVASVEKIDTAIDTEYKRAVEKETDLFSSITANTKSISDEVVRAKEQENNLSAAIETVTNSLNALANRVTINEGGVDTLKTNLDGEIERAKVSESKNLSAVEAEASTARAAEKANADAVVAEQLRATTAEAKLEKLATELDGKLTNEETTARKAESALNEAITTVSNNLSSAKTELASEMTKKANSSDVYTKNEITEKFADYAKTSDVQEKLDAKLNSTDAKNVYATKESLQEVKDTYATKTELDTVNVQLDGRITNNTTAIDNFGLTYNAATSELVYTDKNGASTTYKLYSGSLIKSGEFDVKSNSIVLTIENAGIESKITIPVSELLSDISGKIETNANDIKSINESLLKLSKSWEIQNSSSIELTKTTSGEKDVLTASVKVASSNKQSIQSMENGLYVSNDLEDYTVVFGADGTISGQDAISRLKEDNDSIKRDMETVKETVKTLNESVKDLTTRVEIAENGLKELKEFVDKAFGEGGIITVMQSEIEKIKDATGYSTYTNEKTMSDRLDAIEENVGDKENPKEGTVWYEIENVIDAGTFN